MPPFNPIAWLIRFEGVVQHVHFRASILRLARELGVKGWVQNDSSGTAVLAHLEGEHIQTLIDSILSPNTHSNAVPFVASTSLVPHDDFADFSILPTPL
jgi:hydrogenase maturation protein HypF